MFLEESLVLLYMIKRSHASRGRFATVHHKSLRATLPLRESWSHAAKSMQSSRRAPLFLPPILREAKLCMVLAASFTLPNHSRPFLSPQGGCSLSSSISHYSSCFGEVSPLLWHSVWCMGPRIFKCITPPEQDSTSKYFLALPQTCAPDKT